MELTLPDSIASLPDELFKNCGKLERLVLLHKTDVPALSENALSGAEDLRIYVPKEAYSLYRDGVGCGINTWEGYIDRIYTY